MTRDLTHARDQMKRKCMSVALIETPTSVTIIRFYRPNGRMASGSKELAANSALDYHTYQRRLNVVSPVLYNDGDVAVFIPLSGHFFVPDYHRTWAQRRVGITREQFLSQYEVVEGAPEAKRQMLKQLGITDQELNAAIQKAHSSGSKRQNLWKSIYTCRKQSK